MSAMDRDGVSSELLQPEEQFTRLWTQAQPRVAAYVRSVLPDPHLADDVLQDVAVTCMRKIKEYDTNANFKAWCMGIARIQILRYRREAGQHRLLNHPGILELVAEAHERLGDELEERTSALRQCLKVVSGKARQMLDLRYAEKHSHASIAGLLCLQTESVKVMLSRTRAALKKCIEHKTERRAGHESS